MRQYVNTLTVVGLLALAALGVSLAIFPQWRTIPGGLLLLFVEAVGGVLAILKGVKDARELIAGPSKDVVPKQDGTLTVGRDLAQQGGSSVAAGSVQADQLGGIRMGNVGQVIIQPPIPTPPSVPAASLVHAAHPADHPRIDLPREWLRPSARRPSPGFVGRAKELDEVRKMLIPGARVAITVTIHGAPGVGKTLLAEQLALELDSVFPGGVLFRLLGEAFRAPSHAAPILRGWAAWAFGGREHELPEGVPFAPDFVRALLAGHGPLLVVLDDVWDRKAIRPLLDALPGDACVLITTRHQRIATELGQAYPLDVLSEDDAVALLRATVEGSTEDDKPLFKSLAKLLGYHAQALAIAGGSLNFQGRTRWSRASEEMAANLRAGLVFGEMPFPGEEQRVREVEAALKFSYDDLHETARARLRALGTFAPDADFRAEAAAGVWACPLAEAVAQLSAFVERGLLTRLEYPNPGTRFQQHILLRAYALALLRREGEEDAGRRRHARVYLAMMREADDRQVYYLMLPDYAQLRHAFEWAIEHDLSLTHSLLANTANLQAGFNLVRDNHDWASRLEEKARTDGDDDLKSAVSVSLANALSRLAGLGGEDRRARLRAALAAYDAALVYRTPARAPLDYAMTQNNRGAVLRDLAGLGGEDRAARLRAALDAYDAALEHYTPERAPLDYAMTQNNRGAALSDLAELPGEDRRGRLLEALAAFTEAVRLQPQEAVYHRNLASTNTDLGNFDAAEACLARAAELDPDHPRLAELRQELESARKKASNSKLDPSG